MVSTGGFSLCPTPLIEREWKRMTCYVCLPWHLPGAPLLPGAPPPPLVKILLWDGLPVVRLPASLKKTMLHYNSVGSEATPEFIRYHFRKRNVRHPSIGLEAGGRPSSSSAVTSYAAKPTVYGRGQMGTTAPPRGAAARQMETLSFVRPSADEADARKNVLFLLEAASSDLSGDQLGELVNLPFLPLVDGTLGRFLPPVADGNQEAPGSKGGRAERAVFVCSATERRLLSGEGRGGAGSGAGKRLLEDLETLSPAVKRLLMDKRLHQATNVAVMEPTDVAALLGTVFPEAWRGLKQVAWAPGSRDVSCCGLVSIVALCAEVARSRSPA